eukprot:403343155
MYSNSAISKPKQSDGKDNSLTRSYDNLRQMRQQQIGKRNNNLSASFDFTYQQNEKLKLSSKNDGFLQTLKDDPFKQAYQQRTQNLCKLQAQCIRKRFQEGGDDSKLKTLDPNLTENQMNQRIFTDNFTGDPFQQAFEAKKNKQYNKESSCQKNKGENIMDQFSGDPKSQGYHIRNKSREATIQKLSAWDFQDKDYVGKDTLQKENYSIAEMFKGDPFKLAHQKRQKSSTHKKNSKSSGNLQSYFGDGVRHQEILKLQAGVEKSLELKKKQVRKIKNTDKCQFIHPVDQVLTRKEQSQQNQQQPIDDIRTQVAEYLNKLQNQQSLLAKNNSLHSRTKSNFENITIYKQQQKTFKVNRDLVNKSNGQSQNQINLIQSTQSRSTANPNVQTYLQQKMQIEQKRFDLMKQRQEQIIKHQHNK